MTKGRRGHHHHGPGPGFGPGFGPASAPAVAWAAPGARHVAGAANAATSRPRSCSCSPSRRGTDTRSSPSPPTAATGNGSPRRTPATRSSRLAMRVTVTATQEDGKRIFVLQISTRAEPWWLPRASRGEPRGRSRIPARTRPPNCGPPPTSLVQRSGRSGNSVTKRRSLATVAYLAEAEKEIMACWPAHPSTAAGILADTGRRCCCRGGRLRRRRGGGRPPCACSVIEGSRFGGPWYGLIPAAGERGPSSAPILSVRLSSSASATVPPRRSPMDETGPSTPHDRPRPHPPSTRAPERAQRRSGAYSSTATDVPNRRGRALLLGGVAE